VGYGTVHPGGKVAKGDMVSVINLTGCTGLFLWDEAAMPTAFHIYCSNEPEDGKWLAEYVHEMDVNPKSATIVAQDQAHADALQTAVTAVIKRLIFDVPILYNWQAIPSGQAYRYDVTAGTKRVNGPTLMTKIGAQGQS
jgi:hypothetical protein